MPVRLSFDRVAAIYDETRGLSPRVMSRILAALVDQLQGKRVLEVGVGTGRMAVPLQKSGVSVVGVDISHKMIELGLTKGMHDVVLADGARLPFPPRTFDLSTTNHVLHLVPDWRDVLLEIARVTQDMYFSVVDRWDRRPGLLEEYERIVAEAGHTWRPPGLHERDLTKILTPDLVMPIGPFEDESSADAGLEELERRAFASQWEVPEDVHRAAIRRLRQTWAGKEIIRGLTAEISFWRVDRLAELARRPPQKS